MWTWMVLVEVVGLPLGGMKVTVMVRVGVFRPLPLVVKVIPRRKVSTAAAVTEWLSWICRVIFPPAYVGPVGLPRFEVGGKT